MIMLEIQEIIPLFLLPNKQSNKNNYLMRYMGFASQFFAAIAIALFVGLKIDDFFVFENPWFIWVLPLVVIIFTLLKLIIDFSKKR
jgi:hypothetical protein